MQSSLPERFASLPGLDFDLSYEDCQSLLGGHADAPASEGKPSSTPKVSAVQTQDRHDSMDSCMVREPGVAKARTSRKPRSQEQAREAQKRFRIRQKVRQQFHRDNVRAPTHSLTASYVTTGKIGKSL